MCEDSYSHRFNYTLTQFYRRYIHLTVYDIGDVCRLYGIRAKFQVFLNGLRGFQTIFKKVSGGFSTFSVSLLLVRKCFRAFQGYYWVGDFVGFPEVFQKGFRDFSGALKGFQRHFRGLQGVSWRPEHLLDPLTYFNGTV